MPEHIPVLAQEVIDGLSLFAGATVIDATVGLGGHAKLILEKTAPDGRLIGFDRDARNLALAREHLSPYDNRILLIHDSFANLKEHKIPAVDAVFFDLGMSSLHVDDPSRG
ncbi:16S rRNA (cytosine(1402)-N(4))-methyltransferase, partial [Patescibacteria group bacterium]|nr:16S rRNA (cytosine(1402)-N(4))-methyltransferase [Patescibacteria group bacterium]